MLITRRRFGGLALAAGATALSCPRVATAKGKISLRMGSAFQPGHPSSVYTLKAIEEIAKETNGDVEILFFPASQLGTDPDMMTQVRGGALDMMTQSGVIMQVVAQNTAISAVPFVFENYANLWAALDGELGAYIRTQIAGVGLYPFKNVWDSGFRHMTSNDSPITSPADLHGKKFRVPPSPLWTTMFSALGASPTTVQLPELYSALQTGLVDGQENPISQLYAQRLYEVQKYCSLTQHVWDGTWMFVSQPVWDSLPQDVRLVMEARFNENAFLQRQDLEDKNAGLVKKMEEAGMVFSTPDKEPFRKALIDAGFYRQAKEKFAPQAWESLEKYAGSL
ncbi:TRAP transporter substrate-binding protein [Mesorhizobium sp. M0701]|uniref:TRAP transporter substrate-binding protein n=1 Tax=Mesorhizobium sp. M0701 TaxID=2956989 RepID=UPI00333A6560